VVLFRNPPFDPLTGASTAFLTAGIGGGLAEALSLCGAIEADGDR
jgi:hypothetical protein